MFGYYSPSLVALSIAIAILASYTALDLANRVKEDASNPRKSWAWLIAGALAMGSGIWSMHFIGMLAFHLPTAVAYDLPITVLSLIIAIAVSAVALGVFRQSDLRVKNLLGCALLMGIGIAAMHYTGMIAMRMSPAIEYDPVLFVASVLIAIVASAAALWIAFMLRRSFARLAIVAKLASAGVMGIAIAGMHYTGMAAARFPPDSICLAAGAGGGISNTTLGLVIGGFAMAILSFTLILSTLDGHFAVKNARLAASLQIAKDSADKALRELSNANIIVQNSPVVLYRLKGEPSFPLIYISHNITKLGHEPQSLVASPHWAERLIHPEDQAKVGEAMERTLNKDAEGATIEFRLRTGDGTLRWVENRYIPVRDKEGRLIEVEGIIIDITERKAAEDKITLLARTDGLTGLANRATFTERLAQCFAAAERGATPFAILYLDLDKFKPVNDTFGHPIGDLLLLEVAQRLKNSTRETDLVARLGGDEFAILQAEVKEPANAGALAEKIQSALALPYRIKNHELRISVSIGISPYVRSQTGPDAMLVQADLALYRSKEEGRNQYHFHSDALDQQVLDRVTLAGEVLEAISRGEFELEYQPQVELSSHRIVGMEALIRWNHPTRGVLAPGIFIPVAEKTGTMIALGHWVLDEACRQMSEWRKEGLPLSVVAVNLSLLQLKLGHELVRDVTQTLAKWNLVPSDLEFDVTEAMLAQLTWTQNDVLPHLRQLGVKIAIDDFGSEYSSFDYIRAFRVNHLKIAQSFINRSTTDPESAATIRAIVNFAHDVGITVIAQGVETEQQHDLLTLTDATTQAQGFHFSKPVAADLAAQLLRESMIGAADAASAGILPGDDSATSRRRAQR